MPWDFLTIILRVLRVEAFYLSKRQMVQAKLNHGAEFSLGHRHKTQSQKSAIK